MRVCQPRTVSTEASAPRSLVMTRVGAWMRDRIPVRSVLPLPAIRGLGLCSWWSSNVEPSVSSYVAALRHRPTLPAILPAGSVATRPGPSSVTLYLYTTPRDHV